MHPGFEQCKKMTVAVFGCPGRQGQAEAVSEAGERGKRSSCKASTAGGDEHAACGSLEPECHLSWRFGCFNKRGSDSQTTSPKRSRGVERQWMGWRNSSAEAPAILWYPPACPVVFTHKATLPMKFGKMRHDKMQSLTSA